MWPVARGDSGDLRGARPSPWAGYQFAAGIRYGRALAVTAK